MIGLNLTDRDVEFSEVGENRVNVKIGFGKERDVRSIQYGVTRLSFGYERRKNYRYWQADLEMLRADSRVPGPGKTSAVSVELEPRQPASGFVVSDDLKGFVCCTAAKIDIALGSDLHVLLLAPSPKRPEVRAEKSVLTVSTERAQAIAYLQPSVEGIEVSVSCTGEGIRSARLELRRSGPISFGLLRELNSSERLLTLEPGQSGRVTWSPVNGPSEPLAVVVTGKEVFDKRKFHRLLSALGCRTSVGFLGGIRPEFGDLFVIGDHQPVRHVMELILDVPRRTDVRDKAELEVMG